MEFVAISSSRLRPLSTNPAAVVTSERRKCRRDGIQALHGAAVVVLVVAGDQLLRQAGQLGRIACQRLHLGSHGSLAPIQWWSSGYTARPINAAPATITGSVSFLNLSSSATVTSASNTVGTSTMERLASTITAPVMAAHGGGCDTVDKRQDGGQLAVLLEVRRRQDGEQVARQERASRCYASAGQARDQVADEAHRDDHRPRRDHCHGHRIDELFIVEPVVFGDHAAIEEWHDGQARAKHEGARFGKEHADLRQQRPVD
ncbi:hypothetical protein CCACVL1_00943 [Corchorus capsularis]|uniref:Uncharacterized protein n=1 Tax=Corchorus capsularis TaxID=210143 RepID=A0A1R3KTU5_COCAP|nr:hypothetical protein CCACVL1_00943 [Corchorus capsularis]